jgi:hypothetical protein
MQHTDWTRWAFPLLFAVYISIGFWAVPEYGVTYDEPIQRLHGRVTMDYIEEKLGVLEEKREPEYDLVTYEHRYYGMWFQLLCIVGEEYLGLETFQEQHLLRHYVLFGLFAFSSFFFFQLLKKGVGDSRWATVGWLMLVISPRIFAHSFFNTKDLVMLSMAIFALYSLWQFLERPNWRTALWHGLLCGLATDTRIVGLIFPALTVGWIGVDILLAEQKIKRFRDWLLPAIVWGGMTIGTVILFWPILWEGPWFHFWNAFEVMAQYNWGGEVLLWGEYFYPAEERTPWYYIPSYMLVTLPVTYTVGLLIGLFWGFRQLIQDKIWKAGSWAAKRENRLFLVGFSAYFLPLLAVIVQGSVLYNGWRQLFFIYPGFLIVSLLGWKRLNQLFKAKAGQFRPWWVPGVLAITFLVTLGQMVSMHPHQQVYFSYLAGKDPGDRFDRDYWGASYKQAIDSLLLRDTSSQITFYAHNYPGIANWQFLPPEKQKRLEPIWDIGYGAEYYLTNFYGSEARHKLKVGEFPYVNEVFKIRAGGIDLIGVYRVKEAWPPPESESKE